MKDQGVVDMPQGLRACTALSKSQVCAPTSMSGGSQIPVPPDLRDLTSSSVVIVCICFTYTLTPTPTNIYTYAFSRIK